MENYDEDLNENPFFQVLQSDHAELFQKATVEGWVICIPRLGSVPKYALTHEDFFSHILIPSDELPESHFRTLNDREVRICNRVITVEEQDISAPYSTHILFEETYYTDDVRYKVLCIENPLEQQLNVGPVAGDAACYVTLHTLRECIDLLWSESGGREVLEKMDEIIQEFLETNDNLEIEPLGVQKDLVGKLYTKCLQTALRDARLRDRASKNKHLLENVKLSVETYMHHIIYKKLIKGITGCTAYDDAQLNKIIRNLSDVQLRDLGVRADLYETVPWAKQELARVDGYGTVLGKIGCLRRMVASISKQNSIDGSGTHNGLSNAIAADDLLPMIVFLVIKAGLPNWIAHLNYMKQFHFSVSSTCQVDEDSFLVTSLEAAIEHIKSGILLGPSDPEAHIMNDSEFMSESTVFLMKEDVPEVQADGITGVMYFFEQVRLCNVEIVKAILEKRLNSTVGEKPLASSNDCNSTIPPTLCHPLCSCDKCESVLSRSMCDTTPTINSCDDHGFTALHISCMYGHPVMVDVLISYGSNVDATDYRGATPLHYAAAKGHQNALLLLLHSGATIHVLDNEGNTPLHFAANNGHEGCVKALLYFAEHVGIQMDINFANSSGDTPLHRASRWGYEGIVQILLEYGAYPAVENKRHVTPMDCAHSLHISRLLVKALKTVPSSILLNGSCGRGYDVYLKSQDIAAVTKPPLDFSEESNTSASSNSSLAKDGSVEIGVRPQTTGQMKLVEKLLRAIAHGDIHLACYYLGLDGPVVADVNLIDSSQEGRIQCHPLCVCDKCKPQNSVEDSDEENNEKREVLNVNVCNLEGFTPLHVAAMHGRTDIARLLLDAGARSNVCTRSKGTTPLHLACQNQRVQVVQLLLQSGECDLDIQDLRGNTALHYACYAGSTRLVEILLKHGPMLNLKNASGKTPLEEAKEKMSWTLVRLLNGGKSMTLVLDQN